MIRTTLFRPLVLAACFLSLSLSSAFSATVPVNKGLDSNWVKSLYDKGTQKVYTGAELVTIGMPCGGIGAGQLYVRGDGTLAKWWIFDNAANAGNEYGTTAMRPPSPIDQGFSIAAVPVGPDTVRPTIASVSAFTDNHTVTISFSERIDSASGLTTANYSINNAIAVSAAAISPNGTTITLTTGTLTNAVTYTLTVNNIKDRASPANTIVANTQKQFQYYPQLPNHDFETGNLTGWTTTGTAFTNSVTNFATAQGGNGEAFGRQGNYHVWSFANGGDGLVGAMRSATFTVVGTGQLDFLIGGGSDITTEYVALIKASDNSVLFKATGANTETMSRVTWDASAYLGTQCFFQVVDSATGGWGHINVDDFNIGSDVPADTSTPVTGAIRLDQTGFNAIQFIGEYPIATIKYLTTTTPKPPVDVSLEVFSPFTPLNSKESALPATIMHFTVVNTSTTAVNATLAGWLKDTRVVLQFMQSATVLKGSPTNDVETTFTLNPGEKRDLVFLVAWYMTSDRFMYNNWFATANDVNTYIAANYDRLYAQTHLFHDTYFNTTLPYWFVQRIAMPVSILATETSQWWKNGRFWAWEGVKCCQGTCTHVYNYAQAMAHLFPDLERSVRTMEDLNPAVALGANGLVGVRANGEYAADGQCGTVLKTYREHLMSADNTFLQTSWSGVKKAMDYEITHDPDTNGIIEDNQPNTYDCAYGGPNTFIGSLYLAALRAAEEMAKLMNDTASAGRYHRIFARGKAWTEQNLYKNDYFYQIVNGGGCAYGTGSLADQLFGQTWSHLLNMGYLYSQDSVGKAIENVFKYNWAPNVAGIYNGRVFANSGEAGLIIAQWPFGGQTSQSYGGEVWTGIEYQVATGLLYENKLDDGLIVIRGIHDRYNGAKHNPWDEVECSEHYGRAMASWGALIAVSGIDYDGPAGTLAFAPRMNQNDFRSFFSTAEGWGSIAQRRTSSGQTNDIEVKYGSSRLKTLTFDVPSNLQGSPAVVTLNSTPVSASKTTANNLVTLTLGSAVVVNTGDKLSVSFGTPVGARNPALKAAGGLAVGVRPGVCTITGTLLRNTRLSVALFDLHGKEIGRLFQRSLEKGSYDLRIDLNKNRLGKGAGCYILKVWSPEGVIFANRVMMQ